VDLKRKPAEAEEIRHNEARFKLRLREAIKRDALQFWEVHEVRPSRFGLRTIGFGGDDARVECQIDQIWHEMEYQLK